MEGEYVFTSRQAQRWFQIFKNCENELQDQPRSGLSATFNSKMLCKSVESNPSTSTRILSARLGVSQRTVVRHLKAISKVNKRCKEVPHDLNENQANRRVETCRKLLENPRDNRLIPQFVTSDEKWIYFSNPDKRNQWLDIDQVTQPVSKR